MAQQAAVLTILVKANSTQATTALGKTQRTLKDTDKSARKTTGAFKKLAVGAGAVAAGYASIHGAKAAITTTEDLAKTTLSLSKNLGLSTERASAFAAVLKARGVEGKQVSQAFGTLARNADAAAKGGATQADSFNRLGVSLRELKTLSPDQLVGEIATGMKKLGPGTERTALSMKLFGRGWQTIVPLLRDGKGAMNEQLKLAKKYGATFGGKTITSMKQWIQAQRESKLAMMGLQITFATTIVPTLTKVTGFVSRASLAFRGLTGNVKGLIAGGAGLAGLAIAFGPLGAAVGAIAAGAVLLIRNWDKVGPAIQKALGLSKGDIQAFGEAVAKVWNAIKSVTARVWPGIKQIIQGQLRVVGGIVKVFTGILTGDFGKAWQGVKQIFSGALKAIGGYIRAATAPFRAVVAAIAGVLGDVFGGAWRKLKEVVRSVVGVIGGLVRRLAKVFGDIGATILRVWAKLFDFASKLPGIGGKFKGLAVRAREAAGRVDQLGEKSRTAGVKAKGAAAGAAALRDAIRGIPSKKNIQIIADLSFGDDFPKLKSMKDLGGGSGNRSRKVPTSGRLTDSITTKAKQRSAQWLADHADEIAPLLGAPGSAKGALGKYERIGHGMGLQTTSGFRPGDDGWHGKNRARDLSNGSGPTSQMMRFAKHMFTKYGSHLLELIYTPMGRAIKNGQAVAPYAQADHYDHVHVAAAKGRRTSGILTKPTVLAGEEAPRHPEYYISTNPRDRQRSMGLLSSAAQEIGGKRLAMFARGGEVRRVVRAGRNAGMKGNHLKKMTAIAMAESSGNPKARGDGGWSHGLWQIYTKVHEWARSMNLFNPTTNAKAAQRVFRSQGYGAWTMYKNGTYRNFLGQAAQAMKGGPKRKAKPKKIKKPKSFGGKGKDSGYTIGYDAPVPGKITDQQAWMAGSGAKGQPFTPTRVPRYPTKGQSMGGEGDETASETTADTSAADLAQALKDLRAEMAANRTQEKYLIETHGPKMLAAATVLFSGKFARAAGLGRQTPMAPGRMASL